jgi:hypothetical protein
MNTNNSKHNQFNVKHALTIIAVISILTVFGTVALQPQVHADVGLPPITLTIVALNGTQVVLHENDIATLPSYQAYGGFVKSNGAIGNRGNYTGVPLTTLLDIVGGISSGYSVEVIAPDNYNKTLSYENLNGTGLLTYDNVTGQPVPHNQTLTPMLAYYYNDANLTSGGPLRLVIVGPEGLLTQSSLWVSNVVELEVHPYNLQPMNLTVVALNGTSLTLDQTAIGNLPAITAPGGFINRIGIIKNVGNYTGPSLNTLCNLVGGMQTNTVLRITAADGYTQLFTYDMVNGAFTTYDPVTGNPVQSTQLLTPILAYYFNGANLTSGMGGPLRLAIVGPEGLVTPSSYWVSYVVKLEIRYFDDVAVTNVAPLKTFVEQSLPCGINVTIANLGGYTETINVTVSANNTVVAAGYNLVLANGTSAVFTYVWNTTGFAYGNYTISAYVSPVPDQINTTNNYLSDGKVTLTLLGDVNNDGKVDGRDLTMIARCFGSHLGEPRYNPNCDLLNRGKIDGKDITIAARNFGKSIP